METTETQQTSRQDAIESDEPQDEPQSEYATGMMACPVCGHEMPDLKGGKATICPECGFKDSCCY